MSVALILWWSFDLQLDSTNALVDVPHSPILLPFFFLCLTSPVFAWCAQTYTCCRLATWSGVYGPFVASPNKGDAKKQSPTQTNNTNPIPTPIVWDNDYFCFHWNEALSRILDAIHVFHTQQWGLLYTKHNLTASTQIIAFATPEARETASGH